MEDIAPMHKTATTTVPVHPLLAERWSPRGFDQAHELADDRLTALLEAARWAPSAANSQPWALDDTGQAVAALVTQAQADGLAVHQMGGFDTEAVRTGFGLGE